MSVGLKRVERQATLPGTVFSSENMGFEWIVDLLSTERSPRSGVILLFGAAFLASSSRKRL